ncbi:DoxX family protein [Aeoliella sp. ICT_H6.2]|uniref:DoxX family protein n=1 Tax=Aeoliella straminimaris TaxID=2954799 RepID=A0A9X2FBV0_9BACT|nr:DoxX family protein [Aeoliella straminimaris]MCO6045232.1 DoxX family protein [Aeoliella straminimaris]
MNMLLWVLQILLALHTAMGAVWKFSHSAEQTMPSLKAIPSGVWLAMGIAEMVISVCLVLPAFYRPLSFLIPVAAVCIAAEMVIFCVLHLRSGATASGPLAYWLVVAALCLLVASGRIWIRPL